MSRAGLFAVACLVFVVLGSAHGQDADGSALFADGELAFAAGRYEEALRLFTAARAAGSTGPGGYYNIGVCQYRLGDFADAETTFATLANDFPRWRELAEYNRGLALRARGRAAEARVAFSRARASTDDKIAALAVAQLAQMGSTSRPRWSGYVAGGLGHDDNVALVDEVLLPSNQSVSSPVTEALGVVSRRLGTLVRVDASGYWVHYSDAEQYDQSAVRLALAVESRLGAWSVNAGPVVARTMLDGDAFEELVGADLRLRRPIGARFELDTRLLVDDIDAGDTRFAYVAGSRQQLRLAIQSTGAAVVRVGYDLERNDRADPGVSPSRRRVSVLYRRPLAASWLLDVGWSHRVSRYPDAGTPRNETLEQIALGARRQLSIGWALSAELRSSDNDSTVSAFSYDANRASVGFSRSF